MEKKYTKWDDVPNNLATITQLRSRGLKPAKGQKPVARKIGGYGPYDLYDADHAVARRQSSPRQLAALEQARIASVTCKRCLKTVDQPRDLKNRLCRQCIRDLKLINDRNEAIAWAREVRDDQTVIILDTETTGLDADDEIIQLALLDHTGRVLYQSRFKPSQPVNPGAERIHGISDADLANAPRFADHHETIKTLLSGARVVIYNRDFDVRMLQATCDRYGLQEIKAASWQCAMMAFAKYYGQWSDYYASYTWQKLSTAAEIFGINTNYHDAAADCRTTLAVIQAMASQEEA